MGRKRLQDAVNLGKIAVGVHVVRSKKDGRSEKCRWRWCLEEDLASFEIAVDNYDKWMLAAGNKLEWYDRVGVDGAHDREVEAEKMRRRTSPFCDTRG